MISISLIFYSESGNTFLSDHKQCFEQNDPKRGRHSSDHKQGAIGVRCESKPNQCGRWSVAYCTLCGDTLCSALSHPNVRITSDHGENVLINRLEVQNAIWANELSVKRRALNKQQCIMRLPLTSHSTYWKLVSYTSHLDPHFISTFHLDTQER
eukprot:403813_1